MIRLVIALFSLIVSTAAFASSSSQRGIRWSATPDPGRMTLTDTTRSDLKSAGPRTWSIWIYPAANGRKAYCDDQRLLKAMAADNYYNQKAATIAGWGTQRLRFRKTQAGEHRTLILLLPGQGVAAFNYTFLANALVKRGFAVAIIDLPYLGYARGTDGVLRRASDDPLSESNEPADWTPRLEAWERDLSASIDALERGPYRRSFDPRQLVVAGHSLGGTVALDACRFDPRVRACADFEGAPFGTQTEKEGPVKPTLFVLSRSIKPDRPLTALDPSSPMVAFLNSHGKADSWAVSVGGGSHMSFSDAPLVMPDTITQFGGNVMSGKRSMQVYADLLSAFAKSYARSSAGAGEFRKAAARVPQLRATQVSTKTAGQQK